MLAQLPILTTLNEHLQNENVAGWPELQTVLEHFLQNHDGRNARAKNVDGAALEKAACLKQLDSRDMARIAKGLLVEIALYAVPNRDGKRAETVRVECHSLLDDAGSLLQNIAVG